MKLSEADGEALKKSKGCAGWTETKVNAAAMPAGTPVNLPGAAPPATRQRRKPVPLVVPTFTSSARRAEWTVPLQLERTTNDGALKKWLIGVAGKHRRTTGHALAGRLYKLAWFRKVIDDGGRLVCTLTRLGGGLMDDDNLPPTAKWVRDTVALFLGQEDGPAGPIEWKYQQEPGGPWGVRIKLEKA